MNFAPQWRSPEPLPAAQTTKEAIESCLAGEEVFKAEYRRLLRGILTDSTEPAATDTRDPILTLMRGLMEIADSHKSWESLAETMLRFKSEDLGFSLCFLDELVECSPELWERKFGKDEMHLPFMLVVESLLETVSEESRSVILYLAAIESDAEGWYGEWIPDRFVDVMIAKPDAVLKWFSLKPVADVVAYAIPNANDEEESALIRVYSAYDNRKARKILDWVEQQPNPSSVEQRR